MSDKPIEQMTLRERLEMIQVMSDKPIKQMTCKERLDMIHSMAREALRSGLTAYDLDKVVRLCMDPPDDPPPFKRLTIEEDGPPEEEGTYSVKIKRSAGYKHCVWHNRQWWWSNDDGTVNSKLNGPQDVVSYFGPIPEHEPNPLPPVGKPLLMVRGEDKLLGTVIESEDGSLFFRGIEQRTGCVVNIPESKFKDYEVRELSWEEQE